MTTRPADPHTPFSPGEVREEGAAELEGGPEEAALRARIEEALDLTRGLLGPEEVEEHRRMLLALARLHPRFSSRIEDARPRPVPDRSGLVQKKDDAALRASVARRAAGRGRGT